MDITWKFSNSICSDRQAGMKNSPPFEDIVQQIKDEIIGCKSKILCAHRERFSKYSNFYRYIFCINIGYDLFDLFFNSSNGYRAWFYRSPSDGLAKNKFMMDTLDSVLINWSKVEEIGLKSYEIDKSLHSLSSKAWLAEEKFMVDLDGETCNHCGEWPNSNPSPNSPEIINGRWENIKTNNLWGVTAFYLSKIKIIGAFVNAEGDELIPAGKKHRAEEIYKTGWT